MQEGLDTAIREGDPDHAPCHGEEPGLAQEQPDHAGTARTEGHPYAELAHTIQSPRLEQRGGVHRRQQQEEPGGTQEDAERAAGRAHRLRVQSVHTDPEVRTIGMDVPVRVLDRELGRDLGCLFTGLLHRDARLQATGDVQAAHARDS